MMASLKRTAVAKKPMNNAESTNRVLRLLTELGLLGLFMRLMQVIIIISILQFSSIFKNPSQLNILIPIFICTLIILASVTFAEIQCERYMARLDQRFGIIASSLGLKKEFNNNKNYLQKVFLPVLIGAPALPFLFIFLSLTTPYLFAIVAISSVISGIVVWHFNKHEQKNRGSEVSAVANKMIGQETIGIPAYLLRRIRQNKDSESTNFNIADNLIMDNFEYQDISNTSKKRQYLSLIRKSTRAFVLTAAVLLSILQVTTIAKIAGFLIISGAFRSACIALAEFTTSSNKIFPFSEGFSRIRLALLSSAEIIAHLEEKYNLERHNLEVFNTTYQERTIAHPYLRLKQVTLKDEYSNILIENITGRIQINPVAIVKVNDSNLVTSFRKLFKDMCLDSSLHKYYFSGDIFLSANKLSADFLSLLPHQNPWEITITSNSLVDSFSESYTPEINQLIENYELYRYIIPEKDNLFLSRISNKQLIRMRAIICLLIYVVEPSAVSVSPFTLDVFDENERILLINFLSIELKKKSATLVLLTRHNISPEFSGKCYELGKNHLIRL